MKQTMIDHANKPGYVPGKITAPSWKLTTAPLADVVKRFEGVRK